MGSHKKIILVFGMAFLLNQAAIAKEIRIDDPELTEDEIIAILPKLKFESISKYANVVKKCLDSGYCTKLSSGEIIHPKLGSDTPVGYIETIEKFSGK